MRGGASGARTTGVEVGVAIGCGAGVGLGAAVGVGRAVGRALWTAFGTADGADDEAPVCSTGCAHAPRESSVARIKNLGDTRHSSRTAPGEAFGKHHGMLRRRGIAMTEPTPTISVVVPLYNEAGNVVPLLERITTIVQGLGVSYEIVLVNDGSRDATMAEIRTVMAGQANIVVIDLSRNFGHQLAATAGIEIARGDAVVLMDGDLQDPPELIVEFMAKWRDGFDVVYAVRRTRKGESAFKILTAQIFYRTIKRMTNVAIPVDTGDFRLMSRRVVNALNESPERHRFLRGMVSWVGFNQIGVEYDRDERNAGVTKYPVSKMFRFAIDGITSFSDVPLRFVSYFGFISSLVAFLYAVLVIVFKLFSLNPPAYTKGWASTIVAIMFLGGVQLIGLGILGEYIGRIYEQVKGRPLYLVREITRSPERPAHAQQPAATPTSQH